MRPAWAGSRRPISPTSSAPSAKSGPYVVTGIAADDLLTAGWWCAWFAGRQFRRHWGHAGNETFGACHPDGGGEHGRMIGFGGNVGWVFNGLIWTAGSTLLTRATGLFGYGPRWCPPAGGVYRDGRGRRRQVCGPRMRAVTGARLALTPNSVVRHQRTGIEAGDRSPAQCEIGYVT